MIDIAGLEEIPDGEMLRVDIDDRRLCLINIEDTIYVLDDRCSHADFSLAEGTLDPQAKEVECPKHGALFDVTNGQARCLPATHGVKSYKVSIEGGRVLIEVEEENA